MHDRPRILAFIEDLITGVRIDSVAEEVGFEFMHWEDAEKEPGDAGSVPEREWAEPLHGREAVLIDRITALRPALIIFDLGNRSIPSLEWIALITSVPATRGIPVLAYGPHIDQEKLLGAKEAGANLAVARSKFMNNIPEMLSENAKVVNESELEKTCLDDLPHNAKKGLQQFNRGAYFRAHDLLELAWMEDQSPGRDLYRAILQVSVAYYQIERGNYNGAVKMFLRVRKWLGPLPGTCRGINIEQLKKDVQVVHAALIELGPEGIENFDLELLQPVEYKEIY